MQVTLTENFIIKFTKWQWFYIIATVLIGATILYLVNKQDNLEDRIRKVREAGIKIEQQRVEQAKKTIEQQKAQQEQYKQEIQQQIDELKKQVEAKKAAKLAEAAKAITAPVKQVATAYAAGGSCIDWITQAGVTDVANANELIRRESGCNPNAVNKSSGACGIPQALPCNKLGTSDPVAQIRWMQNYVVSRYGSWANAVAFHNAHNWY